MGADGTPLARMMVVPALAKGFAGFPTANINERAARESRVARFSFEGLPSIRVIPWRKFGDNRCASQRSHAAPNVVMLDVWREFDSSTRGHDGGDAFLLSPMHGSARAPSQHGGVPGRRQAKPSPIGARRIVEEDCRGAREKPYLRIRLFSLTQAPKFGNIPSRGAGRDECVRRGYFVGLYGVIGRLI